LSSVAATTTGRFCKNTPTLFPLRLAACCHISLAAE
jgi:hypothetical protein